MPPGQGQGDGGWGGGGVACTPGSCGHYVRGGKSDVDWQVGSGSTSPPAKSPLFSGLTETTAGYRLNYELTSVLQGDDTFSVPNAAGANVAHVVYFFLNRVSPSLILACDDLRYVGQQSDFFIPEGSAKAYKGSGGSSVCERPPLGLYELRYRLDPNDRWYEGDGEGNNGGRLRGELLVR